jgi:DNA-binding transcriptional LysR family regulator
MSANFEYYKVFYYVAKYRNITSAARELSLTQPSVTKAIQNLETQLGCRLFTRSKKGAALTTEGEMTYQRIISACELIFSAEEEIEQTIAMNSGIVKSERTIWTSGGLFPPHQERFRTFTRM